MKKAPHIFIILIAAATALAALVIFSLPLLTLPVAILYLMFIIWWSIYYYSLEYSMHNKTICIKSGVFFQRRRILEINRILWQMRLVLPFCSSAALTALHTAGGTLVIFCDFSTRC